MSDSQRGMVPRGQWKQSSVHRVSRYSCARCGRGFATPHEVYDHMDAEHPARSKGGKSK